VRTNFPKKTVVAVTIVGIVGPIVGDLVVMVVVVVMVVIMLAVIVAALVKGSNGDGCGIDGGSHSSERCKILKNGPSARNAA